MTEITLSEAQCANCTRHFAHPDMGDFAYGEALLCTMDGRYHATVSGFTPFSERVRALISSSGSYSLWSILASLADPISGQRLTFGLRCPHCASDNIVYWAGRRVGVSEVPEATFTGAAALSEEELARRVVAAKCDGQQS